MCVCAALRVHLRPCVACPHQIPLRCRRFPCGLQEAATKPCACTRCVTANPVCTPGLSTSAEWCMVCVQQIGAVLVHKQASQDEKVSQAGSGLCA